MLQYIRAHIHIALFMKSGMSLSMILYLVSKAGWNTFSQLFFASEKLSVCTLEMSAVQPEFFPHSQMPKTVLE